MKRTLTAILTLLMLSMVALTSCSKDDDITDGGRGGSEGSGGSGGSGGSTSTVNRTVILYISAENNLAGYYTIDNYKGLGSLSNKTAIINGSKNIPSTCNVIAYVDDTSNPYIAQVKDGKSTVVKQYDTDKGNTGDTDGYATSDERMLDVFQWIADNYPADSYATVFWGHGTGPIISNDTIANTVVKRKAFGLDYGNNTSVNKTDKAKWMNIPTLAKVMETFKEKIGRKQDFIMFDACLMGNIDVAYEMKDCADYIMGCPAETPAVGADYEKMLPVLCQNMSVLPQNVVSTYMTGRDLKGGTTHVYSIPYAYVKTSALPTLMEQTKAALATISSLTMTTTYSAYPSGTKAPMDCIYYLVSEGHKILYDMKDIMRQNLSTTTYQTWLAAFNNAVYAPVITDIRTIDKDAQYNDNVPFGPSEVGKYNNGRDNFYNFYISTDTYGGISMMIPSSEYNTTSPCINTTMYQLKWPNAVGMKKP